MEGYRFGSPFSMSTSPLFALRVAWSGMLLPSALIPAPNHGSKVVQPEPVEKPFVGSAGSEDRVADNPVGTEPPSVPPAGNSNQAHVTQGSSVEAGWTIPKRRQKKQKASRSAPFKAGIHALHSSNSFQALEQPDVFIQQGDFNAVEGLDEPPGVLNGYEVSSYRSGRKLVPPPHCDGSQFLDRPGTSEIPESVLVLGNRIAATLNGACNGIPSQPFNQSSSGHRGPGPGSANL